MKNKCILVIGPESTGSQLVSKICSHVLGIDTYGEWNGGKWSDKGVHKVRHFSLPSNNPPEYPDIKQWIAENERNYELYFVLTTRDITISEISRIERFYKPYEQVVNETNMAREIMSDVMNSGQRYFIWSYETFMFLREAYLSKLYEYLGVCTDFSPDIVDANKSRILSCRLRDKPGKQFIKKLKKIKKKLVKHILRKFK